MVWLPAFGIFKVLTLVLHGHRKRVCIASWLWERKTENTLPQRGLGPASVLRLGFSVGSSTHWAVSAPILYLATGKKKKKKKKKTTTTMTKKKKTTAAATTTAKKKTRQRTPNTVNQNKNTKHTQKQTNKQTNKTKSNKETYKTRKDSIP